MGLLDISIDVAKLLFPRAELSEPARVYKWRWTVAISIITIGGVMTLNILWGMGALAFLGLGSGYASASDFAEQKQISTEIRVSQLQTRIEEARLRQCEAEAERNRSALQLATGKLQELVDAHLQIAKRSYRIPECQELIPSLSEPLAVPTPVPKAAAAK